MFLCSEWSDPRAPEIGGWKPLIVANLQPDWLVQSGGGAT